MNISSSKSNNADSPKTPGGISKSLLTPCRRVGLSRKWRKSGTSPFISPLSSASSNKEDEPDTPIRKRKKCNAEAEEIDIKDDSSGEVRSDACNTPKIDIDSTPTRASLPRKKSKILITPQKCHEEVENVPQSITELHNKNISTGDGNLQQNSNIEVSKPSNSKTDNENILQDTKQVNKVSKLSRKNSKSSIKQKILKSPVKNTTEPSISVNEPLIHAHSNKSTENVNNETQLQNEHCNKVKSPNNLTKECMVVIQKKIFKTDKITNEDNIVSTKVINESVPTTKSASQTLFDSDSDDVPLSNLNKTENFNKSDVLIEEKTLNQNKNTDVTEQNSKNIIDLTTQELDDSDFVDKKKVNIKKVEKTTSITGIKKANVKPKTTKPQTNSVPKPSSQSSNSFDDDDDFDYGKRNTILIKQTYHKVTKLHKAKSTGSITQKDIDDIKLRIESKKNLLLAKAMTNETKELRDLIKKWQLGCQAALIELLDLMKKKMPDQNMEQSELLKMLKIPPDLIGYDSDSDCFNTPNDTTIILSALKLN